MCGIVVSVVCVECGSVCGSVCGVCGMWNVRNVWCVRSVWSAVVWVVLHTVVYIYTWQLKVCRSQQTCVNSAKKCAVPGGSNDSKKKGMEESFIQIIQQPLKKKCIIAKDL